MTLRHAALPAFLLGALIVTGCENPAADKPKAEVSAAKPETPDSPAPDAGAKAGKSGGLNIASVTVAPKYDPVLPFSGEDSKIEFTGSKVTGKHEGGFKTFTGKAELSPAEKPEVAKVTADIDMGSTWSDNDKLTGHLKSKDFFDVATYPKATFVSTAIKPAAGEKGATHSVTGNFTLHGVTKSITFPATVVVTDDAATIASEFVIKRKDFDIKYSGMTNDLIRDEVVIRLNVKAPRKKS